MVVVEGEDGMAMRLVDVGVSMSVGVEGEGATKMILTVSMKIRMRNRRWDPILVTVVPVRAK